MTQRDWLREDYAEFERRGMSVEEADRQLTILREPPKSLRLLRPATVDDGILRLARPEPQRQLGSEAAARGRMSKFVPASGAATRMFRDLRAVRRDDPITEKERFFFSHLDRFPFSGELVQMAHDHRLETARRDDWKEILRLMLADDGLGFDASPKALIPFHRYPDGRIRDPFEEQLIEARPMTADLERRLRCHFTISPEHREQFDRRLEAVRGQQELRDFALEVTFSVQHPSTDTIAATLDGRPFRDETGDLLFRPGGHGALLRNLEAAEGDIIFIKNIDNVRPEPDHDEVVGWYHALVGILVGLRDETNRHLDRLERGPSDDDIAAAATFCRQLLGRRADGDATTIRAQLDRPIRVVAVVRNDGEPGGAPFWVRSADGSESLQIVESSQVDLADPDQESIWRSSTHFNPVAIACSVRDRRGDPYDLSRFVDQQTAFVARKSHRGFDLLALEHPGLWNGGMAGWNSIFVEVPSMTFAPVKTVFDLLRPEHQPDGPARAGC